MKKVHIGSVLVIVVVCIIMMFTACGSASNENSTTNENTVKPLTATQKATDELYTSNVLETEEGVVILSSSNYVLGPEASGQFLFMLSDAAHEESIDGNLTDWSVKLVSNGNIYKADFYDDRGNLIASEECNGMVIVDENKEDTYINEVKLYIKYSDNTYTANLVRSGA